MSGPYSVNYNIREWMPALARHLRHEHGWGIRRIAKELVVSEKVVRFWVEWQR